MLIELLEDKDDTLIVFGINSGDRYEVKRSKFAECHFCCGRVGRDCSGFFARDSYNVTKGEKSDEICIPKKYFSKSEAENASHNIL